ncbi:MAG: TetR family transcriptional regulator [Pseudomonadota bacterium]
MSTKKKPAATRRAEILQAARRLLLEEGARALTLRGVAQAVGLKLASVQYYFPTHAELITALVNDRLLEQQRDLAQLQSETRGSAMKTLDAVLRWYTIASAQSVEEGRLDIQFWALAEIDPTAKQALGAYHGLYVTFLADLIQQAVGVTRHQATTRAVAIASLLEGSILFVDLSDPSAPGHHRFRDIYKATRLIACGAP